MIHLELVFIGDVRFRLKFIFCLCMLNSTLFIKENVISPLNCFCAYLKISSPYLYGSLYFPLICVSFFLLIPHCLDYCSFMVGLKIRCCNSFSFILIFQNYFSYSSSFAFLYKFQTQLVYIYKNILLRFLLELQTAQEEMTYLLCMIF